MEKNIWSIVVICTATWAFFNSGEGERMILLILMQVVNICEMNRSLRVFTSLFGCESNLQL